MGFCRKPGSGVHLLMKWQRDAEHAVLPALLLQAEPNEARRAAAAAQADHQPDRGPSVFQEFGRRASSLSSLPFSKPLRRQLQRPSSGGRVPGRQVRVNVWTLWPRHKVFMLLYVSHFATLHPQTNQDFITISTQSNAYVFRKRQKDPYFSQTKIWKLSYAFVFNPSEKWL